MWSQFHRRKFAFSDFAMLVDAPGADPAPKPSVRDAETQTVLVRVEEAGPFDNLPDISSLGIPVSRQLELANCS